MRLTKEKTLVVGLGEVGLALFELLKESGKFLVYGFDVDGEKMRAIEQAELPGEVDVMHVCIPFLERNQFIEAVTGYVKRFKPELVIINSTVEPGTTLNVYERCGCRVAHSPVRGVHKSLQHMKWELKRWTKYVGGADAGAAEAAAKHFQRLGLRSETLKSSVDTELAKLFETTYRAWMVACFQEMHRIGRHFEADFDGVAGFLEDTHRVRLDRPVMFPDVMGGHCVIPNVRLLLNMYDSKFLRLILESNEKRKAEMEERGIYQEVEKLKKRVETLQRDLARQNKVASQSDW
jgi:UDP-N-acetyl-D-mannosaminuronate dehydrogenase